MFCRYVSPDLVRPVSSANSRFRELEIGSEHVSTIFYATENYESYLGFQSRCSRFTPDDLQPPTHVGVGSEAPHSLLTWPTAKLTTVSTTAFPDITNKNTMS